MILCGYGEKYSEAKAVVQIYLPVGFSNFAPNEKSDMLSATEAETSAQTWSTHDPQAAHEANPLDASKSMDCMLDIGMPALVSWEIERNLGHFPQS